MFRNYFITALRFLSKNQLFTSINVVGLAVSIACTMVIYLYISHELTYDEFHEDRDRLYILGEGSKEGSEEEAAYYQTVFPALPAMLEEFPEIETGSRMFNWEEHVLFAADDKKFIERVIYVDAPFLKMFSFPLIAGDRNRALVKKDQIVISEEIAKKLFNSTDIIGKAIKLENGKEYTVSGVLGKIPSNSSIEPKVLISLQEKETDKDFMSMGNWYNTISSIVIKVKAGTNMENLRAKTPAFVKNHYDPAAKERTLKIYPLSDLRQSQASNKTFMYGLSSIGLFILLIAVINFMNLSIASSLKRLKETGLRKVMGSGKKSIIFQFFLEAALLTLVSFVISLGILQITLPMINSALYMSLDLSFENMKGLFMIGIGLTLLIGLVAGGYPAIYLSSFNTVNAVKGIIPNYQNKITLRNALVVVQFVVSIAMIIGVIVSSRQINHMKTADLKFNQENVLVTSLNGWYADEKTARTRLREIINKLQQNPDVLSISLSQNVPGRYWESYNGHVGEGENTVVSLRQASVDENYLATYDIKLLQGENFKSSANDSTNYVMINKAAADAFGWENAVGKTLRANGNSEMFHVIGVFDDFHYRSLEGNVQPLIHTFMNEKQSVEYANYLSLKLMPLKAQGILSSLKNDWKSLNAWGDFDYFFVDEEFDKQYSSVERTMLLITFFAGIAIILSCSGIFALSAIAAQQRTKEIGIRKVMGASITNIISLLSKDFIRLVVVSMVLAVPLAWYGMGEWLKDFAYRTSLEWWIFVLAGFAALTIALITIGLQSVKAAKNNPIDSLRND